MSFLFNTSEDLVLLKKNVLTRLKTFVPQFHDFFRRSQRSYKRNNPQKMRIDDYTLDALFFILCSRSFLDDYGEYKTLMIPVLQSNYGTQNYPFRFQVANNILDDMEEEFQTNELFISCCSSSSTDIFLFHKNLKYKNQFYFYFICLFPK